MGRKGLWAVSGAGAALAAVLLAAAPRALQRPNANWNPEAGAAARGSIASSAPPGAAVQFAGVKVRDNGDENARSVCGSFAVWSDEGTLGPYRDFWVVVAKRPDTRAGIRSVEPMAIPQDAFLDRGSPYFLSCFAGGGD